MLGDRITNVYENVTKQKTWTRLPSDKLIFFLLSELNMLRHQLRHHFKIYTVIIFRKIFLILICLRQLTYN